MLDVISFTLSGDYAAFRDPSISSNQSVYYIPSKSAVIGLLGALLGVERSHSSTAIYSPEYLAFFQKTSIGIKLQSDPRKVLFFTNHRSLEESKTKPFKTEVVISPTYRIYVKTDQELTQKLWQALQENTFNYPPYLGHAYCHARITESKLQKMNMIDDRRFETASVILDENETYNKKVDVTIEPTRENTRIIVERHLHHFFEEEKFQSRVIKHWIPVSDSLFQVEISEKPKLSSYAQIEDSEIVCFY